MRTLTIAVIVLALNSCMLAQTQTASPAANPRFSPGLLDQSIDPCTDFYAYACTKWQAQNPIPSDRPGWGRFNELQERGEYIVRDILQKYSANDAKRNANEQKIGDYYSSCMDETSIEKTVTSPLDSDLKSIADLKS